MTTTNDSYDPPVPSAPGIGAMPSSMLQGPEAFEDDNIGERDQYQQRAPQQLICSYMQSGHDPKFFMTWKARCMTCRYTDTQSCCYACATLCHRGHELIPLQEGYGICDCGSDPRCESMSNPNVPSSDPVRPAPVKALIPRPQSMATPYQEQNQIPYYLRQQPIHQQHIGYPHQQAPYNTALIAPQSQQRRRRRDSEDKSCLYILLGLCCLCCCMGGCD